MAKVREFTLNKSGSYQLVRVCEDRKRAHKLPKKISNILLHNYLPFDHSYTQQLSVSNMLGMKIPDFVLKSGQVYDGLDGKRLIYEVGCNSVIYNLIDPKSTNKYQFFIQQMDDFVFDVTTRSMAGKVAKTTAPVITIVKYEMYFLLGLISTLSIGALIIVVGGDVTVSGIVGFSKAQAAQRLSQTLLDEHQNIESYAPVLHSKLEEFFIADNKVTIKNYGKGLPETIIKDEKTQAQLTGVLVGKATLSPKPFTFWAALFTILTTAVIKSATKSPESYAKAVEGRYGPIIKNLQDTDWNNTIAVTKAAQDLRKIIEGVGVNVTDKEALSILLEVRNDSNKIEGSVRNINDAFKTFQSEIN